MSIVGRVTQELILIDKLNQITCFSYNKKDIFSLLSFYIITFFIACIVFKGYVGSCALIAFLASLINLFIITAIDVFEKKTSEESRLHEEELLIMKKIRDEYQKIFRLKQKHALLLKIKPKEAEVEKNIISEAVSPLNTELNVAQKVHFAFLNRFDSHGQHQNISESNP